MTATTAQRLRILGIAVVVLALARLGSVSAVAILVAFAVVVTVGLFLVPKMALALIGAFLLVQPALVNLAGGSVTPLGIALHRLHQVFAVAAVLRPPVAVGSFRYARRAAIACCPRGTTRCLLPLPKHLQNAASRYRSMTFRFTTSDARQPVA